MFLQYVVGILLFSHALTANDLAQTFVYQGRLIDSNGLVSYTGTVTFKLGIYDPTSTCLLYEESQTGVDLGTTGLFAIRVGSATGDAKRTANDPGLSMATVFSNTATAAIVANGANCSLGGGYTPAANEVRMLRVTITKNASSTTLSPDLTMASTPMATVAQTIQGVGLDGLIQVTGNVTAANLATLTDAGDASALHHHDSLYARNGGASFGVGDSTPDADIEIEAASPDLRLTATANAGNTLSIDFYGGAGGATNRASIKAVDNTNTLTFYTAGAQALQLDANQNAAFSGSISTAGTLGLGKYTDAQETTLATTLTGSGASALGTLWANSTSNAIKYWDGSAVQTIATGVGAGDFKKDGSVAMTGAVSATSGTAGAPGYTFSGDTNTGLYRSGADAVAISAGGSAILAITTGGASVTGQLALSNGTTSGGKVLFYEASGNGANTLTFKAPDSIGTDFTLTLPGDDGNSGEVLTTDGSGTMSWTALSGTYLPLSGGTLTGNLTIGNGTSSAGTLTLNENTTDGAQSVSILPPAITTSYTLTLPTTDGDANQYLKTDGSGNLSWASPAAGGDFMADGSVAMTGALVATSGTAGAPGYTFSGDTNTGFFRSGADATGFAAGGSEILSITTSGATLAGDLTVNAQGDLRLADSDSSNYVALQSAATVGSNFTLTFPAAVPAGSNYMMTGDNTGALSWTQATDAATASTLVLRDSNGRALFADPSAAQDVATSNWVTTTLGSYVKTDGSVNMTGALLNKVSIQLEDPGAGTNKVTLQAPTLGGDYTLTLPVDDGTANQVLTTNGSGTLSWTTPSSTDSTKVAKTGDTMTGSLVIGNGATSGGTLTLKEDTDLGSNTVSLVAPNVNGADYSLTLPTGVPANNTSALTGSTAGVLSWTQTASANTASTIVIRDSNARAQFADPSAAQDAATKNYADTTFVPLAGGTMTGNLTIGNGSTSAGKVTLKEDSDNGSETVTIAAQAIGTSYTLTLPNAVGTSGQYLKNNDGAATLTWGTPSLFQMKRLSADDAGRTSNTFSAVAALTTTVTASTTYSFSALLVFSSTSATPDVKFQLNFNNAPTNLGYSFQCSRTAGFEAAAYVSADETSSGALAIAANDNTVCFVEGSFAGSASTTSVAIEYAQNTTDATATKLLKGSYFKVNGAY